MQNELLRQNIFVFSTLEINNNKTFVSSLNHKYLGCRKFPILKGNIENFYFGKNVFFGKYVFLGIFYSAEY